MLLESKYTKNKMCEKIFWYILSGWKYTFLAIVTLKVEFIDEDKRKGKMKG